jgi:cell division protein FtsW (lipid II flippase)
VAVAILPIALHFAFHDRHRGIIARWTPVILIGFAMPLAISRSGFLGLALAGLCFLPTIPATRRLQLAAVGVGAMAAMSVVVPGLLGTVKAFFEKAGQDNSISARTQDYQYLNSFFSQRPVTGRGFGTFVPTLYDFLDNQYLLTAIEAGTIGVACLLLFLFSGMATARVVARRSTDPVSKSLAQALFAGVVVHAATFATYDALVFPTTGMTLFLTVGAAGALWRLCRESRQWTSAR